MESLELHGVFAHGWPIRLAPHQRLAIGVRPTCKDARLKRYAVAIAAGCWQDGSWQLIGACTGLAPGEATEARAWFFGRWLILQATLGRHQINIAHRGGWTAINKGSGGTCAPEMWHSLPEGEQELELQLNDEDKWYQEVYEAAAQRVGTLLTDPEWTSGTSSCTLQSAAREAAGALGCASQVEPKSPWPW